MIDFFQGLTSVEDIKSTYRTLARQHHPDLGGSLETMKMLNSQYHAKLKSVNGSQSGEHTYNYNQKIEQDIIDKINELLLLSDVIVDLIGTWIWVRGETKPHREKLKELGCFWHAGRKVWYWKPKGFGRSRSNPGSLDSLALKYGCTQFTNHAKQLTAV
jgi:hypothetical protein